jgi:hypothetical protein
MFGSVKQAGLLQFRATKTIQRDACFAGAQSVTCVRNAPARGR